MKKRFKKKYEKTVGHFDRRNFGSLQFLMSSFNYDRWFTKRFYQYLYKSRYKVGETHKSGL